MGMDVAALTTFVWQAMAGGVIGNATYDGLKHLLGKGFQRLSDYVHQGQREPFNTALQTLLETSDDIREGLTRLSTGDTTTGNISTGTIQAGGNVIVGHHNIQG